jgi:hypothetical protein
MMRVSLTNSFTTRLKVKLRVSLMNSFTKWLERYAECVAEKQLHNKH